MTAQILTLNAGSSSLKFALFEAEHQIPLLLAAGQVEALERFSALSSCNSGRGEVLENTTIPSLLAREHEGALQHIVDTLNMHFPAHGNSCGGASRRAWRAALFRAADSK